MLTTRSKGFPMAGSASNRFKPLQLDLKAEVAASILRAMGNPKRLLMLHYISDVEMPVKHLAKVLSLSQSSTTQHLAILLQAGLVTRRRESQTVCYSVASPHVRKLLDYLRFMV